MTVKYLVLFAPVLLGGCYGLYGHDEVDRYFQRSDTITMSAGDAKQANAVTHTITPWPHYVGDRRIVVQASKTDGAVKRYERGTPPRDPLPAFGGNTPADGHPPMGTAGAAAAAVDAGASVVQGTGTAVVGSGGR